MLELDHKEGWALKNWCFWTVVLEKTLENILDCKIKAVNPKGNQFWIFIGRTDAEAPILWPPDAKSWLIGKDPDAGKGWRQEEKGTTEDKMVGWHHGLNGHESEQTPEDCEGQGSLACCSPWVRRESDTTEQLNNNIHTLLHTKQIVNKDLLYNAGNSTQYSVITSMRKESDKEWIYVHVQLNHFAECLKVTQHCSHCSNKSTIL